MNEDLVIKILYNVGKNTFCVEDMSQLENQYRLINRYVHEKSKEGIDCNGKFIQKKVYTLTLRNFRDEKIELDSDAGKQSVNEGILIKYQSLLKRLIKEEETGILGWKNLC